MTQFLELADDGRILAFHNCDDAPEVECTLVENPNPFGLDFWAQGPTPTHTPYWVDGALTWVQAASLEEQRQRKIEEMRECCAAQIMAGFESTALGAPHWYPANPTDQTNLIASVTDSLMALDPATWTTTFWCADTAGEWLLRDHTVAQIQQVGRDGKAAIMAAIVKNEALRVQASTATAAELDNIVW